jgi:hypothetical protein
VEPDRRYSTGPSVTSSNVPDLLSQRAKSAVPRRTLIESVLVNVTDNGLESCERESEFGQAVSGAIAIFNGCEGLQG